MKIFKILIVLNFLIILLGCDKKEENTYLKGNIVGFINLVDENGVEVEDKSGVNVSINGLSNSATTNRNGRYELSNVPAGTYNLIYTKAGYGNYNRHSYQFIGGNIPALLDEITLYEQPNIEVQNLDISFNDDIINITCRITETSQYVAQVFINDSSNVSNINYDYASAFIINNVWVGFITSFSQEISLSGTPYSVGDKIYLVVYFINPYEEGGYYDYKNHKYIHSSYKRASSVIDYTIE